MASRSRARTREIRTEMAKSGENFTRSAAAVGGRSTKLTANLRTDAVREHVRRVLEARLRDTDDRYARIEQLEQSGHRIVSGGQVSQDDWNILDWRTGEVIAEGSSGLEGYDATADRLDPSDTWIHIDRLDLDTYEPSPYVSTPGIPETLGRAREEWVDMLSTPDEEIAEFVAWPVEKVREHRAE